MKTSKNRKLKKSHRTWKRTHLTPSCLSLDSALPFIPCSRDGVLVSSLLSQYHSGIMSRSVDYGLSRNDCRDAANEERPEWEKLIRMEQLSGKKSGWGQFPDFFPDTKENRTAQHLTRIIQCCQIIRPTIIDQIFSLIWSTKVLINE